MARLSEVTSALPFVGTSSATPEFLTALGRAYEGILAVSSLIPEIRSSTFCGRMETPHPMDLMEEPMLATFSIPYAGKVGITLHPPPPNAKEIVEAALAAEREADAADAIAAAEAMDGTPDEVAAAVTDAEAKRLASEMRDAELVEARRWDWMCDTDGRLEYNVCVRMVDPNFQDKREASFGSLRYSESSHELKGGQAVIRIADMATPGVGLSPSLFGESGGKGGRGR